MEIKEAVERMKTGNFSGEYGFDFQILLDVFYTIRKSFECGFCLYAKKEVIEEMEESAEELDKDPMTVRACIDILESWTCD